MIRVILPKKWKVDLQKSIHIIHLLKNKENLSDTLKSCRKSILQNSKPTYGLKKTNKLQSKLGINGTSSI